LEEETRYDKNYNEGASFKLTLPSLTWSKCISFEFINPRGSDCFGSVAAIETLAESIDCYEDSQEG